jgi:hypothetical protein
MVEGKWRQPGDAAPSFRLPAINRDGVISLDTTVADIRCWWACSVGFISRSAVGRSCSRHDAGEAQGGGRGNGRHDYVTKPFDAAELRARLSVGVRVVEVQAELAARIAELEEALAWITFTGSCPSAPTARRCGATPTPGSRWEAYVSDHSAFRRPLQPRGVPGVDEGRPAAGAGRVEAGARLAREP